MQQLERKNDFLHGVKAGMAGAAVKYGFNELMQLIGIAKYDNNVTSLTVVFSTYQHTPFYWLIGFLHALMIGAFFGVCIAFVFDYILTPQYYLLKSLGIGVFIYFLNFGLMARAFHYPSDLSRLPGDVISMFISLLLYAAVTGWVLKKQGFFEQSE
ncbi:MAG: hypothetical protein GX150_07195 [Firmicutes bacterium]|jgi:hypothetical protein|nr:hypothetical protein [Bacillota bacterium]